LEQKRHGYHCARAGRHIPRTPTYDPEHVVAGEGKKESRYNRNRKKRHGQSAGIFLKLTERR